MKIAFQYLIVMSCEDPKIAVENICVLLQSIHFTHEKNYTDKEKIQSFERNCVSKILRIAVQSLGSQKVCRDVAALFALRSVYVYTTWSVPSQSAGASRSLIWTYLCWQWTRPHGGPRQARLSRAILSKKQPLLAPSVADFLHLFSICQKHK